MITFVLSILALVAGFIFYGKFVERFFGANNSIQTPAYTLKDNVDYIPMPVWKVFVIEFLNIAGLGPIFGAVLGAMYGPMSYIWIVFGCIFMGAVHDYFSGMLSVRSKGASLPELVGKYLGAGFRQFLRVFTLLLLIFVGVAFVTGPAGLLGNLTNEGTTYWLYAIFIYYLLATLLPINKIIGQIYPVFSLALLFMAIAIGGYILVEGFSGGLQIKEITVSDLTNQHGDPVKNILYPMMFIVISCGAISGFHSTQAPMMARCLKKESHGRYAFYGAMVAEGIVAIIWATAAMNYFGDSAGLNDTILNQKHDPAWVVNEICNSWLGKAGAVFAIIGVIVLPITTGDTAFRSARLTVADMFRFDQKKIKNRLIISIPLFAVGYMLSQIEFSTIWKYLGLSNQVLSCIVLWTISMYLIVNNKNHYLISIPAFIMTAICVSYLLVAPYNSGGLSMNYNIGIYAGIAMSLIIFALFVFYGKKKRLHSDI